MRRSIALAALFALAACGGALAADHSDNCTVLLTETPIRDLTLMRVGGKEQIHFADCFAATCIAAAYVVPGDLLVAVPGAGDLVCTVFPNKKGGTKGWIPSGFLNPEPAASNPPLAAWAGKWELSSDAEIEIRVEGDGLAVKGQAFWMSGTPGVIHDGELAGKNRPKGDTLELPNPEKYDALESADNPEYVCAATLLLLGPYLVVQDNKHCGGLNVSFSGVYRRK